jgi:hypothetical protein
MRFGNCFYFLLQVRKPTVLGTSAEGSHGSRLTLLEMLFSPEEVNRTHFQKAMISKTTLIDGRKLK